MKKFTEYSSFNLSDINREVLEQWNASNLFEQSMKEREGAPSFVFSRDHPRLTECRAYTMSWHAR